MGNLVHVESWKTQGRSNAVGLAPVACYDPYFHRMVHHLRKCLVDGHPVLARLHPAAQYPVEGSDLYSVDLEGHAVLIVGYDDERRIFAISDPWDRRWGGQLSGLRWIGYDELSLNIVDSTLDYVMVLAPLQVDVRAVEEASAKAIEIDVGFYEPAAIVMDRDTQEVREVGV